MLVHSTARLTGNCNLWTLGRGCCHGAPQQRAAGTHAGGMGGGCCPPRPCAAPQRRAAATHASAKGGGVAADKSLSWVPPENRKEVMQLLDSAERAAQRWELSFTPFLSPPLVGDVMSALAGRSDIKAVPWGGYSSAERCRLVFGREELMEGAIADPGSSGAVAALQVKGNFMFDPAAHPDFLGAILGTGVVRDRVGDVLVQGERGAQILVDPELVEHFETSLTQVRTVPVETVRIPLSQLAVPPPSVQEINSVEASMRLDALASAGFRMSRSRMAELIKSGDVRVNWRPASKTSVELKEGDVVSCTGKGRLEVRGVTVTKKEKYAVTLVRSV